MARPGKEKAIAPASMDMDELLRRRDAVSLSSLSFVMHLCSFHPFSALICLIPILSLILPSAGAGTICVSAPQAAFHPKNSLTTTPSTSCRVLGSKVPAYSLHINHNPPAIGFYAVVVMSVAALLLLQYLLSQTTISSASCR